MTNPATSAPSRNTETIAHNARLTLRALTDDDLDFLCEMLGDPEVMSYWPAPFDRAGAEEWLRKQQRRYREDGCGYWLVVDNETHQPVGQAGVLMTVVEDEPERLASIGYIIHRPFQRKGYAFDASRLCLEWMKVQGHQRAFAQIRPENEPSLALARKLGMRSLRNIVYAGFEHILFVKDLTDSPPES